MGRRTRHVVETGEPEVSAESFAHSLSAKFLQCRELGHVWRPWTVDFDRKSRSFSRQLRCSSCRTVRQQILDSSGHVVTNSYRYAEGYMAKHLQPGTYSRDVFRLEAVTRFLDSHAVAS